MENKDFFDNLKRWSKRKHRLLENYLPPFSAKVASTTLSREVYCVDCFAGAAKYDDGSEGSPILMANFSDVCANWKHGRAVTLKLINVEPDLPTFSLLEEATKEWKAKGVVENINSKFNNSISEILTKIGKSPTLFFIDPFGPKDINFSDLVPILQRSQHITELIINFDTDGLHRIARAALSPNTKPKTAESDGRNVDNTIGSNSWRNKLISSNLTTEEGEEILLREYVLNLNKFGFNVVDYAIRESLDKRPKYHFIYCTRHKDGVFLMNNFIREEDDLIYGEHIEDKSPLFQTLNLVDQEIAMRREKLREIVCKYLKENIRVNRRQIKHTLAFKNFGMFHEKDYNFVVKQLIDQNLLKEVNGKRRINETDILEYFPK